MAYNKNLNIILGIDPGIADTGFGIIKEEGGKLVCIDYGSMKTAAKLPMDERLDMIHQELSKIIEKYRPDLIAVEQIFFCKNVKTALIVGHARGVIILTARQKRLPI